MRTTKAMLEERNAELETRLAELEQSERQHSEEARRLRRVVDAGILAADALVGQLAASHGVFRRGGGS